MVLPTQNSRIAQYDPAAQGEFDRVLGELFGGSELPLNSTLPGYGVDVREDADHIYVEADLPGFRKEDVDVTLENSLLTITAERREQTGEWLLRERRTNRVQRSFRLPPSVREQSVQAALADGVLTVTLDKREESKPRKIAVT